MSIPVSVIVARTALDSRWQDHWWRTEGIVAGHLPLAPGTMMGEAAGTAYVFAGTAALTLHATETDSYVLNLGRGQPQAYVVLAPPADPEAMAPDVHLVTAAPDEAEAYLEGDEWLMDGVPMPSPLAVTLTEFVAAHHVAAPPKAGRRHRRAEGDHP